LPAWEPRLEQDDHHQQQAPQQLKAAERAEELEAAWETRLMQILALELQRWIPLVPQLALLALHMSGVQRMLVQQR
jgi:hypothetical protein